MRLQVKGKNVEVSDAIRSYAEEKLGKLERQLADPTRVELELTVENNPSIADKPRRRGDDLDEGPGAARERGVHGHARLDRPAHRQARAPGQPLPREAAAAPRRESAAHKHANGDVPDLAMPEPLAEDAPMVSKTKQFTMIPMGPEEAVLQLELVGHDFFVFRNDRTREINVVYRRKDGDVRPDRAGLVAALPAPRTAPRAPGPRGRPPPGPAPRAEPTGLDGDRDPRRPAGAGVGRGRHRRGRGRRRASAPGSSRCPTRRSSSRKGATSSRSRSPSSRQRRSPYRAEATRRSESQWAVGIRELDVVELADDPGGDEVTLTVHDGERTPHRGRRARRSARSPSSSATAPARGQLLRRPGAPARRDGLGGRGDAALGAVDRGCHVHPGDRGDLLPRGVGQPLCSSTPNVP